MIAALRGEYPQCSVRQPCRLLAVAPSSCYYYSCYYYSLLFANLGCAGPRGAAAWAVAGTRIRVVA